MRSGSSRKSRATVRVAGGGAGVVGLLGLAPLLPATSGDLVAQPEPESVFDVPSRVWVVDGIRVPSVADTFALIDVRRWPRLDLGFSLHYATPITSSLEANLYIYPIPSERLDLPEADVIASELDVAVRGISDYASTDREGMTVEIESREDVSIQTADGPVTGMRATGYFERSGDVRPTSLYVFVKGSHYLKYRISYDLEDEGRLQPHLAEWVRVTYDAVEPRR